VTAPLLTRRHALWLGAAPFAGLAGCDALNSSVQVRKVVDQEGGATRIIQRALLSPGQLAPEYGESDISRVFRPNGSIRVDDPVYRAHLDAGFKDWRLVIEGLVRRPLQLSLAELMARPARTQITRHDCVEGWSCIGKWTGAPLGALVREAGLLTTARYLVFHCADMIDPAHGTLYYESIGLAEALHPQTILAYAMNGAPLPEAHGAPLRLRVERQLGYKQAKYVMRIAAVDRLDPIYGGKGGYWEDSAGYEWWGGI
jgi:DMSO/TMAO reductase YedYZ molybdopterin-dependent catalytic subunit